VDTKTVQGLYRQASRILPDTPEGMAFLNRVLSLVPKENTVQASIEECESYLKQIPDTHHALEILKYLHRYYSDAGDKKPMARCEELLQKVKLSRDNCRAFYQHFSPSFTDYHVLGPFQAVGERRGLDFFMQPEKGVDLTWTTKGIGEIDQGWTKITFNKDDKARHGDPGYVDLHQSFMSKMDRQLRSQIERGPYFGYAYVKINVPTRRRAMLLYGANDALSIWVNGNRVVNEATPGNGKDRDGKIVTLNKDVNEILIKVGIMQGKVGFYFRVADENGRPFDDLTFP
jgi:hypothetical protein